MSAGEAIVKTFLLVLVAGATAGLWLNLVMWIPMLVIGWVAGDDGYPLVSLLAMLVAAAAVAWFGLEVLDLPVVAAALAGLLVGITSYARPNPARAYEY